MAFEPWGYGNRWFDRMAARRRPGTVIVGVFFLVMLIVTLARG